MRIDIGVGGRFHSDRMAHTFLEAGDEVRLVTSFPASRFTDVPRSVLISRPFSEVVFRILSRLGFPNAGDLYKMKRFGRTMAEVLSQGPERDLFFGWSSFSLETLQLKHARHRLVVRDSAHVLFQSEILRREYDRLEIRYPDRQDCEARELAEYELADTILLPSEFARRTFERAGVAPSKLRVLPLAVNTDRFRPAEDLTVKLPLKVVYFGTLSVQKGVVHLLEATKQFKPGELQLTLIGHVDSDFAPVLRQYSHARHFPPMDQVTLGQTIRDQHVFVFPTLHDGFGQVLPQAMASGLVPIATENCGAIDWIENGVNGIRVRAGHSDSIRQALADLIAAPAETAQLRQRAAGRGASRSWADYSRDLLALSRELAGETPRVRRTR